MEVEDIFISEQEKYPLTSEQLSDIATLVSASEMEKIALSYLKLNIETVRSLREQYHSNLAMFKVELLDTWKNRDIARGREVRMPRENVYTNVPFACARNSTS